MTGPRRGGPKPLPPQRRQRLLVTPASDQKTCLDTELITVGSVGTTEVSSFFENHGEAVFFLFRYPPISHNHGSVENYPERKLILKGPVSTSMIVEGRWILLFQVNEIQFSGTWLYPWPSWSLRWNPKLITILSYPPWNQQQKPLTLHGFEDEISFWDGLFSIYFQRGKLLLLGSCRWSLFFRLLLRIQVASPFSHSYSGGVFVVAWSNSFLVKSWHGLDEHLQMNETSRFLAIKTVRWMNSWLTHTNEFFLWGKTVML